MHKSWEEVRVTSVSTSSDRMTTKLQRCEWPRRTAAATRDETLGILEWEAAGQRDERRCKCAMQAEVWGSPMELSSFGASLIERWTLAGLAAIRDNASVAHPQTARRLAHTASSSWCHHQQPWQWTRPAISHLSLSLRLARNCAIALISPTMMFATSHAIGSGPHGYAWPFTPPLCFSTASSRRTSSEH